MTKEHEPPNTPEDLLHIEDLAPTETSAAELQGAGGDGGLTLDPRDKFLQTQSNIQKSDSDTKSAIINNMKS